MTETRILALDTTTEACSVALAVGAAVTHRWERLPRGHAAHILPMLEAVLAEAGCPLAAVDAIAFCRGPGSFTGVRIAAGVVQGLAYGIDRPVVPVSTLAAIAQGALRERGAERVLTAVDARMGEVYWAGFERDEGGLMTSTLPECVAAPCRAPLPAGGGWHGCGTGFAAHGETLSRRLGQGLMDTEPDRLPDALDCLAFAHRALSRGETVSAFEAVPVYLRDRVAG